MKPNKIVIVDKDQLRRDLLRSVLPEWGYKPFLFERAPECLDNFQSLAPDLAVVGPHSFETTMRLVNFIKSFDYGFPLILLGADEKMHDYVASSRFNNVIFETERINIDKLQKNIQTLLPRAQNREQHAGWPLIIGNSPEMIKIRKLVAEISRSRESVCIFGEPGTGRDHLARAIHHWSDNGDSPLVKVNVAELFNGVSNEKVSFGPSSDTTGVMSFDWRDLLGGNRAKTLFLDKIEHMPLQFQKDLLAYFESNEKNWIQADSDRGAKIRIICSTHTRMGELLEKGQFLRDLYYRLCVFTIRIPALKNRAEDIALLMDHFADTYCRVQSKCVCEISDRTKETFMGHNWPGNIAELESAVKRIIDSGSEKESIEQIRSNVHYLDFFESGAPLSVGLHGFSGSGHGDSSTKVSLKQICKQLVANTEKKVIKDVLNYTNWNRKKAASVLEISYRSLLNKIKQYELG